MLETMSRRLLALSAACLLSVGAAACGDENETGAEPTTPAAQNVPADPGAAQTPGNNAEASCTTEAEGAKDVPCPTPTVEQGKTNVVEMQTSEGSFEITLDTARAPITANSFAYLAKKGFYDGTVFHRVVPGFVIQGGDPYATGTGENGGSGGPGYSVVEAPPADAAYTKGVVAMAKTGAEAPGTSGSQFYVVSGEDAGLPADYAIVGTVTKGLGTVAKIDALGQGDGPPSKAVTVEKAELLSR